MIDQVKRSRLKGAAAAQRIQKILEVRERIMMTHERVDVFDALAWLDVQVIFKSLDGLLGAYIRGENPGVMISTKRPLSVQRFTAAHELGHAVMKHEPSLDSPNVLRRAAMGQKSRTPSGFASYLQEIEADAFASTFLLPNWLITHHAQKHGWTRSDLCTEDTVYQLSLRCGSSYQATVWALERNGIIPAEIRSLLLDIKPRELKQRIGHTPATAQTKHDAWVLDKSDDKANIAINVGDTITVELKQQAGAGYLWMPETATPTSLTSLNSSISIDADALGSPASKRAFYRADDAGLIRLPFEHKRPWEKDPIDLVAFNLTVMKPEAGLSQANRMRQRMGRDGVNAF